MFYVLVAFATVFTLHSCAIQNHSLNHNCGNGSYIKNTNCSTGVIEIEHGINLTSFYSNGQIFILSENLPEMDVINIYAIDGKLIKSIANTNQKTTLEIPFSATSGIYIITYHYKGNLFSDKIVVSK